jgi:hypothetical protein
MFERLEKPFLTVETGEAYQPIRLTYTIYQKEALIELLNGLKCCRLKSHSNMSWDWLWTGECETLKFESLDSYKKNPERALRLGTLMIRENNLHINLTSFKRACLAVPFFYKFIKSELAKVTHADFLNKVFELSERLPHGLSELFNDKELEAIVKQRGNEYQSVLNQCEQAENAESAFHILSDYTQTEAQKRLPYVERYIFPETANYDNDVIFLSFYIFLRGRELVAIRRWFGQAAYSLADAADETMEQVFGEMHIDLLDNHEEPK